MSTRAIHQKKYSIRNQFYQRILGDEVKQFILLPDCFDSAWRAYVRFEHRGFPPKLLGPKVAVQGISHMEQLKPGFNDISLAYTVAVLGEELNQGDFYAQCCPGQDYLDLDDPASISQDEYYRGDRSRGDLELSRDFDNELEAQRWLDAIYEVLHRYF